MLAKSALKTLSIVLTPLLFTISFLLSPGSQNIVFPEANRGPDTVIVESVQEEGAKYEYSFDLQNEVATLTEPDGTISTATFFELKQLASGLVDEFLATPEGLRFLLENGLEAYAPALAPIDTSLLQSHPWCRQATQIAGALNTAAWRALAMVIGMHPLVRIVTVGGHAAFWVWVRRNC